MVEFVVTSPLSLARIMWWHGEDTLWPAALALPPNGVAALAARFAELHTRPELVESLWPGAPALGAHVVIGTIEHFEGRPRPAARRHNRIAQMPDALDISEEDRWADPALAAVLRLIDQQSDMPCIRDPAMLRPRLHGRWASA